MGNKKKGEPLPANPFRRAVETTTDIASGYCKGLQALGSSSKKVNAADTKGIEGSVNIDDCTKHLYPNGSRWDYCIGYAGKSYFVEVHPANTSNVQEMIKKADWLKQWLDEKAPGLKAMAADNRYYWLPSGRCDILPTSTYQKMLAQRKIVIKPVLKLPTE